MLRGYRYKLAPTADQAAAFDQFAGVCRLIFNLALEQRSVWYRQFRARTGRSISFPSQSKELTALRSEFDWIGAVSGTCQTQALRDLDRAFANFFAGRAKYPAFQRRGDNDSFRFKGSETAIKAINAKWSAVWIPKIGLVKFRDTRQRPGAIKSTTIRRQADGWYVIFACEVEAGCASKPSTVPVGIDRGIVNTLTLSTGQHLSLPATLTNLERRRRRAQSVAARRRQGSARKHKAQRRVASLFGKIARVRSDWHHKTALSIARTFGLVVMERLDVSAMTASARGTIAKPGKGVRQKAGLNRSILNQGWFAFETILSYKLEERGGTLAKVDPAYTSLSCSECGCIDRKSRESQARFACVECGHTMHADHNAAINILRRNTAWPDVEGLHQRPREASSGRRSRSPETSSASLAGAC